MAYRDVVMADSPIAYWRLGEPSGTAAEDETGTYDGIYANGPTLGVAGLITGDANTAVTFGGGQYVNLGGGPSVSSAAFSAEIWLKFNDTSTVSQVFWEFYEVAGSLPGWGLGLNMLGSATNKLGYWSDGNAAWRESTGTITDSNRHYVVVTQQSGTGNRIFYIDGVEAGTDASSVHPSVWAGFKYISLQGTLDEAAVYQSELSAAQVLAHYNAGITAPASGPPIRATTTGLRFS